MTEADSWIWSIMQSPRDESVRLVAADWFEERGDEKFAVRLRHSPLWVPHEFPTYNYVPPYSLWVWQVGEPLIPYIGWDVYRPVYERLGRVRDRINFSSVSYHSSDEAYADLTQAARKAYARLPVLTQ